MWLKQDDSMDGNSLGSPRVAPAHKGELPPRQVEGGVTYTGSCHCGKVTVAVNCEPLDETFPLSVIECNCSVCERVSQPLPSPSTLPSFLRCP